MQAEGKSTRKWRPQWTADYFKLPANRARIPSFHLHKWGFDTDTGKPKPLEQKHRPIMGASQDTARPERFTYVEGSARLPKTWIPLTWEQVLWITEQGKDGATPIKNLVGRLIVEEKISSVDLTPRQKSALARSPEVYVLAAGPSSVGQELADDLEKDAHDPQREAFFAALTPEKKAAKAAPTNPPAK